MINWHDSTCRRPDVVFFHALDAPSCQSCGEIGILDNDTCDQATGPNHEPTPEDGFDLRWPSCLPYVEDDSSKEMSKLARDAVIGEDALATDHSARTRVTATSMSPLYETLYARKIRLLQLLPGSHTDPIRCKLQIADLSNKPEYEALSYTWAQANGDTARSQRVYLGDRYDMLAITVNCANALRRLRSPNRSRMLWVDSICINQENIEERSHQVGIMQYIYATALRVLIYLGEDPEDPNPTTSKPWMFENHGNNLELSQDLVSQPYFTRMWVIQEIASARFAWVLYGSRGARWQDIMISPEVDSTDGRLLIKDDNYRQLVSSHPWLRSVNLPRHRGLDELYQFLTETRGCQASDTRDKVFALLGLFVGARDAGLIPDYSLNKGQVLAGVTASCLLTHPRAWVHCFAMVDRVQSPDMPSWAVNWLSPLHQAHSDLGTIDHARWRDESSRSPDGKVRMKFSRKGALIVQGIPFCRLANCLPSVRLEQVKAGPLGVIRDIFYDPDAHDCLPELQDEIIQKSVPADQLFCIDGLPDYRLVLKPLQDADTYSFVAICEPPRCINTDSQINALSRKLILLLSAWNEILLHDGQPPMWKTPQPWEEMKEVCGLLTYFHGHKLRPHTRNMVDALFDDRVRSHRGIDKLEVSRQRLFRYSLGRHPPPGSELERRVWPGEENAPKQEVLTQVYWDFGATANLDISNPVSEQGFGFARIGRVLPWTRNYNDNPLLDGLKYSLDLVSSRNIVPRVWPESDRMFSTLTCQLLSAKAKALREFLDRPINLDTSYTQGKDAANFEEEELERVRTSCWLMNSMELRPNPALTINDDTWADSFLEVLYFGISTSGTNLQHLERVETDFTTMHTKKAGGIFTEISGFRAKVESLERKLMSASDLEDISDTTIALKNMWTEVKQFERRVVDCGDSKDFRDKFQGFQEVSSLFGGIGKTASAEEGIEALRATFRGCEDALIAASRALQVSLEERRWNILLELVRETEEHMLPLEKLFTSEVGKVPETKDADARWREIKIY